MEPSEYFGRRLATIRARDGVTIQQLAASANVSRQTIWKLETGRLRNPDLRTAARLARALRVSLDYLAGTYSAEELLAIAAAVSVRFAMPSG